jgi:DNA processing protein
MVEGAEQSGAKITVDFALEQGREVFAVPGNIFGRGSSGPNKLIQQGAKLVTSVDDIVEELNLKMAVEHSQARAIIPDTPAEAAILAALAADPVHIDELGQCTGLSSAELSSTLTMMELKGQVRQVGGMNYVMARETSVRYVIE